MARVQVMFRSGASKARIYAGVGSALFGLLSLFLVAFGVLYANVSEMLWFHAAAVPEAVRGDVRPLYFALMKLIGGSSAAVGLLGGFMTFTVVRRGSVQSAAALTAAFAIPLLTAAYVAETLAARTGSPTSWHIMGVLLAIDAAAFGAFLLGRRG